MASSPSVSPSLTRSTTATDTTGNLTPSTAWTSDQEARLTYCQDQLKQAQKKWSDRQELWIREVDHLLELKRAHAKAQKKKKQQKARAGQGGGLRKAKTWRPLSRTQSSGEASALVSSSNGTGGGDKDENDEEEEDSSSLAGGVERSDSLPLVQAQLVSI
ncbi:MAG: hypothetical protein Q9161_005813 [Pseudevernia consocians]